jgi:hypothetical protein
MTSYRASTERLENGLASLRGFPRFEVFEVL